MSQTINGILLLDKPTSWSSNFALQRVKKLFKAKKAGHTGSLDPIATGMLPICFGQATKFSQFLLESDKSYSVVAKLGVKTTTGDSEGSILLERAIGQYNEEIIETIFAKFLGITQQLPPMFSAIKHQGTPLYKLARQGIEIERSTRAIHIKSLLLEEFSKDELSFHVHCSKGTYVRTLVEDIGEALGCGAHVIKLRRTKVIPYDNFPMYSIEMLEEISKTRGLTGLLELLLPLETSVEGFPAIQLSTSSAFYLKMGQSVRTSMLKENTLVRLISEDEKFLGVGMIMPDGRVKPHRLIA